MHGPQGDEKVAQMNRLKQRLDRIRHKIVVLSGKGGVGKSTVSVNLAVSLAQRGYKVGILDTDIHGPNVPHMLGIEGSVFGGESEALEPVQARPNLWVSSIALAGQGTDTAFIWRGPLKISVINQLMADVMWPALDYLVIDSPPGTGDEPLTVCQTVTGSRHSLIVTTPQGVSVLDARRTVSFTQKLQTPCLGLIENMSGYFDAATGNILPLFGEGGGQTMAAEVGIDFLGAIPMDPRVVAGTNEGRVLMETENGAKASFEKIVDRIVAALP